MNRETALAASVTVFGAACWVRKASDLDQLAGRLVASVRGSVASLVGCDQDGEIACRRDPDRAYQLVLLPLCIRVRPPAQERSSTCQPPA